MHNFIQSLKPYLQLTRMNRPIGSLLLMWPMLVALWLAAEGLPDLKVLVIFVLGVLLMRSAGCAINDYADRELDGHVWRTVNRPLATGALSPAQAVMTFVVLSLVAFVLVLQLNQLTIALSFVAVGLAALYPFMKRYTHFPQVILGMAFGWAIPMAFAAQTGEVPILAWWLFAANIVWTLVYDTFYAMADRDDDLKIGIKSTAVLFGRYDRLIVGLLQIIYGLFWLGLGITLAFSGWYFAGLAGLLMLFVYQQWLTRHREAVACFRAFLNNNWAGACLFGGVALHYLAG